MPRPKKVIVLPESQIQDSLTNGRVTVAMLATAAGCSVPTMRKHLAEAFGDRITFSPWSDWWHHFGCPSHHHRG
jgi:hypothetical protein